MKREVKVYYVFCDEPKCKKHTYMFENDLPKGWSEYVVNDPDWTVGRTYYKCPKHTKAVK